MFTSSFGRKTLLFVLAAVLATPWAVVAGPSSEILRTGRVLEETNPGLFDYLWSFLLGVWAKEGCGIDPDGAKAGCHIDPNGTKAGCGIDADGRPLCTP